MSYDLLVEYQGRLRQMDRVKLRCLSKHQVQGTIIEVDRAKAQILLKGLDYQLVDDFGRDMQVIQQSRHKKKKRNK